MPLGPAEAGRQLELQVMRGPLELRLVLATGRMYGWACISCGWMRRRSRLKN
jgi:hypothetical protein